MISVVALSERDLETSPDPLCLAASLWFQEIYFHQNEKNIQTTAAQNVKSIECFPDSEPGG